MLRAMFCIPLFSQWYSCILQTAACERGGRALQHWDDGHCQQGNTGKPHLHHLVPAPHAASGLSPPAGNPSHVSCSMGTGVGAALGFAISCSSGGGCTHGRAPELLPSTLDLIGGASCHCHTATPATGPSDNVGTQEQNHCRGWCWSMTVLQA